MVDNQFWRNLLGILVLLLIWIPMALVAMALFHIPAKWAVDLLGKMADESESWIEVFNKNKMWGIRE